MPKDQTYRVTFGDGSSVKIKAPDWLQACKRAKKERKRERGKEAPEDRVLSAVPHEEAEAA